MLHVKALVASTIITGSPAVSSHLAKSRHSLGGNGDEEQAMGGD